MTSKNLFSKILVMVEKIPQLIDFLETLFSQGPIKEVVSFKFFSKLKKYNNEKYFPILWCSQLAFRIPIIKLNISWLNHEYLRKTGFQA